MSAELLKKLQTQLHQAQQDLAASKQSSRLANQKTSQIQRQVQELEEQISRVPTKTGIVVSEHAMLRYLERVKNLDLDVLAAEILDEKSKRLVEFAQGNCTVKKHDHQLVVKNHVVVTVKTV